jgi:thiol:disulfide interchange protein
MKLERKLLVGGVALAIAGVSLWKVGSPQSHFVPLEAGNFPTADTEVSKSGSDLAVPGESVPDKAAPTQPRIAKTAPLTEIRWENSWESALEASRVSGKPIMVDFYTDWCGFCKKLDADVFTDKTVIAESANFVSIKINAEKHPDLAQRFRVEAFPTILWIDSQGATIDRLPGYADPAEFAQWMRSAASKISAATV